jgi:DNA-binding CsgD family transcriptional regulator
MMLRLLGSSDSAHAHESTKNVPFAGSHDPMGLFELLRDAIAVFDPVGTCVYTNPAFVELAGFSSEDSPTLLHEWGASFETFASVTDDRSKSGAKGITNSFESVLTRPEGTHLPVTLSFDRLLNDDASLRAVVMLVRPRFQRRASDRAAGDANLIARLDRLTFALGRLVGDDHAAHVFADDAGSVGDQPQREAREIAGNVSLEQLSQREVQILTELVAGKRVGTIAASLFLSENTVRNYLKRIYRKLGVHSLSELREYVTPSVNSQKPDWQRQPIRHTKSRSSVE